MPQGFFFVYFRDMGVFKFFVLAIFLCGSVWAMPSANRVIHVQQADGSQLSLRSVGNEIHSYKVTEDGFAVARNQQGYFCYLNEDGSLSDVRAMDVEYRTGAEIEFLSSLNKDRVISLLEERKSKREYQNFKMVRSEESSKESSSVYSSMLRMPSPDKNLNSGARKALVVLVQFDDVKFIDEDPKAEFEKYLNQEGYNVYNSVGSVRDYFNENSSGKFIPNFDVVGPITVPGSAYKNYGNYSKYGSDGARVALSIALDSLIASNAVDFTQYDNNGDYELDFVHMIYAGLGSNDSDQDSAMWPHMWDMRAPGESTNGSAKVVATSGSGFRKKTYYVGPYACSNELDGVAWSYRRKLKVGVGPFIHEFGHLLGLGDHYATNGEDIYTLGNWDVMDGGAYNCPYQEYPISCAPPYLSAFERMYLGWMKIPEITAGNGIKLAPVSENTAMKVSDPKNSDEFYVLEYRNRKGWDVGLPNHGMLIWHIDYLESAWQTADINTSAKMRVDIVEADGKADYQTITADVFPGTSWGKKYTSFEKFITHSGKDLGVSLTKITEANDYSYVSFNVNGDIEESSSSEIPVESSSSVEPESSSAEVSSSSEVVESSSSVNTELESSSSVESISSSSVEEKSSSSVEPPKSSSSEESSSGESSSSEQDVGFTRGGIASLGISVSNASGVLHISGLPLGEKTVRVFSLNGNMLMSRDFNAGEISLEMVRHFGKKPVIVQVLKNHQVILNMMNR